MAAVDEVHREACELPVKQHNLLMTRQYVFSMHHPDHVCHSLTQREQPARHMKYDPMLKHLPEINHLFTDRSTIDDDQLKAGLKHLHTAAVEKTKRNYKENVVLGGYPPPVCTSEKLLSSRVRSRLCQLRTGFSKLLYSYLARIDPNVSDVCPECNAVGHTTRHLFECPAKPTALSVESLWTQPTEAALFLQLDRQIE